MKHIIKYTQKKFLTVLRSRKKEDALKELVSLFDREVCPDSDQLFAEILEREEMLSTGIGFGIAIPHLKSNIVKNLSFAIGISREGIDFDSIDGIPTSIIVAVVAQKNQQLQYLQLLSRILRPLKDDEIKSKLINAESENEMFDIIHTYFE